MRYRPRSQLVATMASVAMLTVVSGCDTVSTLAPASPQSAIGQQDHAAFSASRDVDGIRVFSGAAADSAIHATAQQWAALGDRRLVDGLARQDAAAKEAVAAVQLPALRSSPMNVLADAVAPNSAPPQIFLAQTTATLARTPAETKGAQIFVRTDLFGDYVKHDIQIDAKDIVDGSSLLSRDVVDQSPIPNQLVACAVAFCVNWTYQTQFSIPFIPSCGASLSVVTVHEASMVAVLGVRTTFPSTAIAFSKGNDQNDPCAPCPTGGDPGGDPLQPNPDGDLIASRDMIFDPDAVPQVNATTTTIDDCDPSDGTDPGTGLGPNSPGCHTEEITIEESDDDGATWHTIWQGSATVCD